MKSTRKTLLLLLSFFLLLSLLPFTASATIVDDNTECPNNPNATWSGHDWQYETNLEATCMHAPRTIFRCSFCGKTYTYEYGALGDHSFGEYQTVAPTCTEPGKTWRQCTVCHTVETWDTAQPLGHAWDEGQVTKPATCKEEGVRTFTCSRCGETRTESIPQTTHQSVKVTEYPTCTEPGSSIYQCAICGEKLTNPDYLAPLGHEWDEGQVTKPATCKEEGVRTFTCSRCGETRTEPIPQTMHQSVKVTEYPTCTEPGSSIYQCAICGEKLTNPDYLAPLGHEWDEGQVTKPATCKEEGVRTFTCSRCGETKTEPIPQTMHQSVKVTEAFPTCTEPGSSIYKCAICGEKLTNPDYLPPLGHDWDEGKVTAEPTCTQDGAVTYTCTRCGITRNETVEKYNHQPVDIPAVAPTCTESGSTAGIKCALCGLVMDAPQIIPATGHSPVTVPAKRASCTNTGLTEGSKCSVCGKVLAEQRTIQPLGHSWDQGVKPAGATCTEPGMIVYTCTRCGITREETVPAMGHTPQVVPAVEATCTESGLTEGSKCSVCGETLTNQRVINALGHLWDEGTVIQEPAVGVPGLMEYTCQRDPKHTMTEPIPALTESEAAGTELMRTSALISGLRRPVYPIWEPVLGTVTGPVMRLALHITEHPQSCSIPTGGSCTLTVKAEGGTPPYTYEWHRAIVSLWKPIAVQSPADGTSSRPATIGGLLSEIVERPVWKTVKAVKALYTAEAEAKLTDAILPATELRWRIPPTLLNLSDQIVATQADPTLTVTEGGCQYWCVVKDSAGNTATSNKALVSYFLTPALTMDQDAEDWNMHNNEMWRFDVRASGGTLPYTYQWYAAAPGATAFAPLNVNESTIFDMDSDYPALPADDPSYSFQMYCIVTDANGNTVKSREAEAYNLTVEFTSGDYENQISPKGSIELAAEASGSFPPFTYQWYVYRPSPTGTGNSAPIAGETGNSITVSQPDWYMCMATDAHGHTEYAYCVVRYDGSLRIAQEPEDCNMYDGDWWGFSVVAEDGAQPYTYQWYWADGDGGHFASAENANLNDFSMNSSDVKTPFTVYCTVTDADGCTVESMSADAYRLLVTPASEVNAITPGEYKTLAVDVLADFLPCTCKWYITPLDSMERTEMAEEGEEVTISEPGIYACEVTDAHGHWQEIRFFVDRESLWLEIKSDARFLAPGETGELAVLAHGGIPPYQYVWYREGAEMMATDQEMWTEESRLPISEPGIYWCQAADAAGTIAGADFFVDLGLSITEEPQDCNMWNEGYWSFYVGAEGGMQPCRFEWFVAFDGDDAFSPISQDTQGNFISSFLFPDGLGNQAGGAFSVYCTVTDEAGNTVQSQVADAYNLVVGVVPDGKTKLNCEVSGDYAPFTYAWYKVLGVTAVSEKSDLEEHGSSLTVSETGCYMCVVTDSKGHEESGAYYLQAE